MSRNKVLVIDDSFLIRKSLTDQLAGERFEVYEAKDGPSGLAKAEEVQPDVILLDFVMPGMNGYEVYQALRANPKFTDTPVIVISSSYDEVVNKFGYPFVGFDFLAKQFTKDQLEERINAVLPMIVSSPEHVAIAITGEMPAFNESTGMLSEIQAQLTEISQQLQKAPAWLSELPQAETNGTVILSQLQALEAQIQAWEQRPPADTLSGHLQELSQGLAQVQEKLLQEVQHLGTKLTALEAQAQHNQLGQDTLTQLVTSLQGLNENIVNLPRTDAVLERLTALEAKAIAPPQPPSLALLIGAVALGAFIGAAIGASVVGGQRQSHLHLPSSVSAGAISARSA
ncbi:response regulator [Gloeomargarita lithophora Alchichica-D10]|uniref:Response regulator n=1 Tax=Gloeomargarita lithophora Alchichica-D10 TaxID=1188229 RepID=A0A1J0A9H0_9CYAN|nr:response regulator [Gloeomargarita lithophora]APB32580.1 response regulator [Gloeomargarita lithophora Alchichica-D10]